MDAPTDLPRWQPHLKPLAIGANREDDELRIWLYHADFSGVNVGLLAQAYGVEIEEYTRLRCGRNARECEGEGRATVACELLDTTRGP